MGNGGIQRVVQGERSLPGRGGESGEHRAGQTHVGTKLPASTPESFALLANGAGHVPEYSAYGIGGFHGRVRISRQ